MNFIICSSAPKRSFLLTSSFTLSFSIFSSYSSERLLISSVKAASCIISNGVSLSFFNNSDHFDYASSPKTQSQSGLANDPSGALAYLGLFFLSASPSLSLSLSVLLWRTLSSFFFCLITFFSNLALLRLARISSFASSSSWLSSYSSYSPSTSFLFFYSSFAFYFFKVFLDYFWVFSNWTLFFFVFSLFSSAAINLSSSYSSFWSTS